MLTVILGCSSGSSSGTSASSPSETSGVTVIGSTEAPLPIAWVSIDSDGLTVRFFSARLQGSPSSVSHRAESTIQGHEIVASLTKIVAPETRPPSVAEVPLAVEWTVDGSVVLPEPSAEWVLVDGATGVRFPLQPPGVVRIEALLAGWQPGPITIDQRGTRRQDFTKPGASLTFIQQIDAPPSPDPGAFLSANPAPHTIDGIPARLSVSLIGDTAHLLTLQWQPGAHGLTLNYWDRDPADAEVMSEPAFLELAASITRLVAETQ